jgi:hypothetical protein
MCPCGWLCIALCEVRWQGIRAKHYPVPMQLTSAPPAGPGVDPANFQQLAAWITATAQQQQQQQQTPPNAPQQQVCCVPVCTCQCAVGMHRLLSKAECRWLLGMTCTVLVRYQPHFFVLSATGAIAGQRRERRQHNAAVLEPPHADCAGVFSLLLTVLLLHPPGLSACGMRLSLPAWCCGGHDTRRLFHFTTSYHVHCVGCCAGTAAAGHTAAGQRRTVTAGLHASAKQCLRRKRAKEIHMVT